MSPLSTVLAVFRTQKTVEKGPLCNENNKSYLSRQVSQVDVEAAMKSKAMTANGKQYISTIDPCVLGSYNKDKNIDSSSDDILSRLVIERSTHLSSWKNDSLVGNGEKKVTFVANLMPTWNSNKKFMHLSRLIVWVVPTIPNPKGFVKATLVDQNKTTIDEKIIVSGQSSLADPMCFIFHLSWSIPKERNTLKQCTQLVFTSNEKYTEGISFASVMYAWAKNFCDTPIAAESTTCDVIPINRAKVIRSAALIEACKLLVPKGTSGKQITNQIKQLQKIAEKCAMESEGEDYAEEIPTDLDEPERSRLEI
uniref:Nonstructural protein n=1 Tax=Melon yellow spot virus TaxID=89471 RepID=A0A286QWR7_9VIRU|nr:nonstructural protein [Melon yellow spot virus]